MKKEKSKKFKFKTPHTYALLLMVIIFAWIMTYVIPAGEYAREKKSGQTVVVSGSYHEVANQHLSFLDIFRAVPEGLVSGGEIVFYVFLVGGAFGIVHQTGAFDNAYIRQSQFFNDSTDDDGLFNFRVFYRFIRGDDYFCTYRSVDCSYTWL